MILTLEKQVTNLEISKEMKELGFPQDSEWWWSFMNTYTKENKPEYVLVREKSSSGVYFAAPTAAEVLCLLPGAIDIYILRIMKTRKGEYLCQYKANEVEGGNELYYTKADTLVDSAGLMYNYLKKEGLL